jgi:hypothetical protein
MAGPFWSADFDVVVAQLGSDCAYETRHILVEADTIQEAVSVIKKHWLSSAPITKIERVVKLDYVILKECP